jgi:hypothetical protein
MAMLLNNDNESLTLAERMDEAVRNEFRDILQAYQEIGSIPEIGETGIYFRFDTRERGVKMPEHLFEANPDELTIVLQHAFWGLEVWHEAFEVSLSFAGGPERIRVPFSSLLEVSDNAGFRHVFSSLTEIQKLDRFLASQEVQDDLRESARMSGNPAQIDLVCSHCGKAPSRQDRAELENPGPDGKYPEFICAPCHKKEYEVASAEFDCQSAQEERQAEMERLAEDGRLFWLNDFRDQ